MTTRMIERWFPCADVSKHSASGVGNRNRRKEIVHLVRFSPTRPSQSSRYLLTASLAPRQGGARSAQEIGSWSHGGLRRKQQ